MMCQFFLKNDSYILQFYLEKKQNRNVWKHVESINIIQNVDKVMSERVEGTSQSSM
jgi:hypothetical protein